MWYGPPGPTLRLQEAYLGCGKARPKIHRTPAHYLRPILVSRRALVSARYGILSASSGTLSRRKNIQNMKIDTE